MKIGLQIILGLLSLIPLLVSILGITMGLSRWLPTEAIDPQFDSQYRYITGYYLSLSLLAWWVIPNIEKHRILFRIIGGSIFFGGIGRVLSWLQVGAPDGMSVIFTGVELLFPLLLLWQAKLPKKEPKKEHQRDHEAHRL
ncbi:MAG: DUF4345 domain-containing protein [Cyanobacteria bacterium J06634_6]